MSQADHRIDPRKALFADEKPLPDIPVVDHYAGSEKLMHKALALQQALGPIFDVTCDCEDGAHAGAEAEHARMAAEVIMSDDNRFGRVGARIHDIAHPHWQRDLEILIEHAGNRLAFLTLPKVCSADDALTQIRHARRIEALRGITRPIPFHVLIETHGGLREVWRIAAIEGVESLDFGLMDFVSAHQGAIMGDAMRSPGQFTHPLIVRAKTEIAAAALAHGVIPSHNVTTELKDASVAHSDALAARRQFGYLRMWSIHPAQIEAIVTAMRPDFSEVNAAAEILCAAQDCQWGPTKHEGRLHDRASYRYYWNLLRRARTTGMTLPGDTRERFFGEQAPA